MWVGKEHSNLLENEIQLNTKLTTSSVLETLNHQSQTDVALQRNIFVYLLNREFEHELSASMHMLLTRLIPMRYIASEANNIHINNNPSRRKDEIINGKVRTHSCKKIIL